MARIEDYYPEGAYRDSRAPYNHCTDDKDALAVLDVCYEKKCNEADAERLFHELTKTLKANKDVKDFWHYEEDKNTRKWHKISGLAWEYDEDDEKVVAYGEIEFKVVATVYFNYVYTKTAPEPTSEDINDAAEEQYLEVIPVDGWELRINNQ